MLARLIEAARSRKLAATVMTFEPQPQEFLAPDQAPARLTNLREKLQLLGEAGVEQCFVCRFDDRLAQLSDKAFIERVVYQQLGTKWLLVGDDFRFGARRSGTFETLASCAARYGYEVEAMSSVQLEGTRVSSTAVRSCLQAGDLDGAERMLGRSYRICGRVERGDGIGRKLGYATANVQLKRANVALAGIFVVEVEGLADECLPGVASLGVRPTVSDKGRAVLEVHLFDFNRDIYGRRVGVRFLQKLRDEVKFSSVDELVAQMNRDAQRAREFFLSRENVGELDVGRGQRQD